ncbi:DUF502 domain-containing protein [bacterium]|nr:DUF502 domain-containing protein [bacterium]
MTASPSSSSHEHQKKHRTTFERLRTLFLAGVLVIVPMVVAVYAVLLLMRITESIFGPAIEETFQLALQIPRDQPPPPWMPVFSALASFVMAISVILAVGWASTFLLVRRLIGIGESLIARVPLLKFFYNVPKEVLHTFALQQKASFKRVVFFEYPRKGIWALGFATGEVRLAPTGVPLVAVFVPTTPNPTSGFLLYFKPEELLDTNLPLEEGARLIISGGILSPDSIYTQSFCGLDREPSFPPNVAVVHTTEPVQVHQD